MNIDRENLKELFNKIIDIITNDYNIIFENEEKKLSIVDAYEWDNEFLCINSVSNVIRIVWEYDNDYTFGNIEDAMSFIRAKMLARNFEIFLDNNNISEDKFKEITKTIENLED